MNDLSTLRNTLGGKSEGIRIGTVSADHGSGAYSVRFDTGAARRVYGSASKGDRVTVRGDRILSKVADGSEKTVYIP